MAKAGEGVTVHRLDPIRRGGAIFFAAMTPHPDARQRLIAALWAHLAARESSLWQHCQSAAGATLPMQVVTGPLGRPCLRLGEFQGPAISFSESGGKVWAALCGDESAIGIDVAAAGDFQGAYPHHRVFHPSELEHALGLTDGAWAGASALLWSIKEAAVKALGCGFHLVDPRQITVAAAVKGSGLTFPVGLSGPAQARFPLAACRALWVRSLPQGPEWLSIAQVQRSPSAHG